MKFTPVRLAQSQLAQLPIVDGQLIFAWDTGNVYVDTAYGRFQQGISMLSDSSEIPLAPADKLYFNKDTKQLLYNGQNVFAGGMQKVAVGSDAVAQIGKWYLCFNNAVITLPAVHNEKDTVKVSTVLDVDNVTVIPADGDTVQSDSGFLLDIKNSAVQFVWLDGRWVASQVIVPRQRTPLAIVDGLPGVGQNKLYYDAVGNRLRYWDGAWKGVADYQDRISALEQQEHTPAYGVKLGKCTDLGVVYGSDSILLTWRDPQNVQLETALLAEWKQTVLMKKTGQYPTGPSDSQAQTIAVTSKQLGNKNHYVNSPVHQSPSDSTYYKLFSQSIAGEWNDLIANCYPLAAAMSWGMIQAFVRAGRGPEIWPVGTVFEVQHPQYTVDGHGIYFRVAGYDQVPAADESLTHTMCLDMVGILFSEKYDEGEYEYALTADTTAQAGKSYYVYSEGSYTKLIDGTDYDVGDPVPVASWYEKNLEGRIYGSNNAEQNNMIQWANSTGAANQWFVPQTLWDQCSSTLAEKNGFMRYLDSNFADVVQSAKLTSIRSIDEGGGSITHNAKFWALTLEQIAGGTSGRLKYYADGGSLIKKLIANNTPSTWILRTAGNSGGNAYMNAVITGSGEITAAQSRYARGYSLACIIA